jgi:hypothetical protein
MHELENASCKCAQGQSGMSNPFNLFAHNASSKNYTQVRTVRAFKCWRDVLM